MKFIIGKKLGMTRIFNENGYVNPVTLISAEPNIVTQVLTKEKHGYDAVQLGAGEKKVNKPLSGHLENAVNTKDKKGPAVLKEFKLSAEEREKFKKGQTIDVSQFNEGDNVIVKGVTKGKGFQGVVKRWNFSGESKTHGTKDTHRAPGSIGSSYLQRVLKGKKMGGRMGNKTKTILNLKVAYVNQEKNIIGVKGAVPGNKGDKVFVITRT